MDCQLKTVLHCQPPQNFHRTEISGSSPPDFGERNFQAARYRPYFAVVIGIVALGIFGFGRRLFAGRERSLCLESGFFTASAFRKLGGG